MQRRLEAVESALSSADRITALKLSQERLDLQAELEEMHSSNGVGDLEDAFVGIAANYSVRQGITYAAWRQIGVRPDVLRRAGISRAS